MKRSLLRILHGLLWVVLMLSLPVILPVVLIWLVLSLLVGVWFVGACLVWERLAGDQLFPER